MPASSFAQQVAPNSTPSLYVEAPRSVAADQPIALTLRIRDASNVAGFEASLRFDNSAATYETGSFRNNSVAATGRGVELVEEIRTGSNVSFGFFSCPTASCSNSSATQRITTGASGDITLGTVTVTPLKTGVLSIQLEDVVVVDPDGNELAIANSAQALTVRVGNASNARNLPTRQMKRAPKARTGTPGPFEQTRNSSIAYDDAMEVAFAWARARYNGNACNQPADTTSDVDHNSCVDIGDLQQVTARYSTTKTTSIMGAQSLVTTAVGNGAPKTFVVNDVGDTGDPKINGVCETVLGNGVCTLRAAIQEGRAYAGPAFVHFNIPGDTATARQIFINSRLPELSGSNLTIDGYTQPGASPNTDPYVSNAKIRIEIVGKGFEDTSTFTAFGALYITSPNNVVRGLALYNAKQIIRINGTNAYNNVIAGNFIGTNAAGTRTDGKRYDNSLGGMCLDQGANKNTIGGRSAADRNVISGNSADGVSIKASYTSNNVVINNLIGSNPAGNGKLMNYIHGVDFDQGVYDNVLGGTGAYERNVVSGHARAAIQDSHNPYPGLEATPNARNKIIGNYVGLDPYGQPQTWAYSGDTTDSSSAAIDIKDGVYDAEVAYNRVGNAMGGIQVWGFDRQSPRAANIHDNIVGIAANGAAAPNSLYGIRIGDMVTKARIVNNTVTNNPVGVELVGASGVYDAAANGNTISQNSLYSNGTRPGIDLSPQGVTQNDLDDADTGPNDLLNFPVIGAATTSEVSGTACANCTVEVFLADKGAGAYGSGKTFLGSAQANVSGVFVVPISGVVAGQYLTSTATDVNGSTSEFSLNAKVAGVAPTATATNTPTATSAPPTATATDAPPTATDAPPTATATDVPTSTSTQAATDVPPTATATDAPTSTPTNVPTATSTPTSTPTALPSPTVTTSGPMYQEQGGTLVMEAEYYNVAIDRNGQAWGQQTGQSGYVGSGFMVVPNSTAGALYTASSDYPNTSPELRYNVNISTKGTYYVWLRVYASGSSDDSIHSGLDNGKVGTADNLSLTKYNAWTWIKDTLDSSRASMVINSTGQHTINLWPREDGMKVDRILLTTDAAFVPSGNGPAASTRTP